ncbi:MAG: cell wall anchor protein [Bacteroidetes bacterium]|jgi:hypothetical protein|nr:cell wall anchor protein [Bacteroidota bacterium]
MKQIFTFCLPFLFMTTISLAQTKKIAWKSHSGSAATFSAAFENELFDMNFSNFGMAPTKIVKNAKLDSVIFISDHKAIMVTSEYCYDRYEKTTTLWEAGKDTVIDHPLFSRQHSLDSIKNVVKHHYYFRNPVDSVKFIGFDNKKIPASSIPPPSSSSSQQKPDEQVVIPVSGSGNSKPPFGGLPVYIGILVIGSLFAGLFSWNYRQS